MGEEIKRPLFKGATFIATKLSGSVDYKQCVVVAICRVTQCKELPGSEYSFKFDDKFEDPESPFAFILMNLPNDLQARTGYFYVVINDELYMIHRNSVVMGRLDRYVEVIQKLGVLLFLFYIATIFWPLMVRLWQ